MRERWGGGIKGIRLERVEERQNYWSEIQEILNNDRKKGTIGRQNYREICDRA